ncbi:hypothetical protein JD969_10715 [Planctomycetota bacterium]|nr:hypothetical protein JD969_10715 [Planctomycetota bacterium]
MIEQSRSTSRRKMLHHLISAAIPGCNPSTPDAQKTTNSIINRIEHEGRSTSSNTSNNAQPNTGEQLGQSKLQDQIIDIDTVNCLFSDIAACTKFLSALPRYQQRTMIEPSPVSLDEARLLTIQKQALAVQLRYEYEGKEWWDTLMLQKDSVRLIRIAHSLNSQNPSSNSKN